MSAIVLALAASFTGCLPMQRAPFDRTVEHERIMIADSTQDVAAMAADSAAQDSGATSESGRQHGRGRHKHTYPLAVNVAIVAAGVCAIVVIGALIVAPFKALHDL